MAVEQVRLPLFYEPYPYQAGAWIRRAQANCHYYFKLWARQLGKDTDDMQHAMNVGYRTPGLQIAYVGLDNVWITNNIFRKYLDGRLFWDDYPAELIDPKDTAKEVYMKSQIPGKADTRIKFIGFLNNEGVIGSSYDRFYISEASLYRRNAFEYITPIWERKLKMTGSLQVNFNGTPRGIKNVFYDLLRTYTCEDEPDAFPGWHDDCYVDKVTIADATDRNGDPLYTQEEIEELRDRYIRAYGNDNLFRQENFCDFTTVNAGLVYLAIERVLREKRYCSYNLDTSKPVYIAFDIASKGKETDSTAAIIYQYINNRMIVFDCFEARGISLVQGVQEIAKKPYFHNIRVGFLPWDSERSASSMTPKEEAEQMFQLWFNDDAAMTPNGDGGLAVLFGNIAQDGCVVKTAGVDESLWHFEGPAVCFDSQEDACEGILGGKVKKGALVFKYNETCATADVDPVCCYDTADLFAKVKVGKEETAIAVPGIVVDKWSVFGKDLAKAVAWETAIKQGKKVTLESDLFLVTPSGVNVQPADPADPYVSVGDDGKIRRIDDIEATLLAR